MKIYFWTLSKKYNSTARPPSYTGAYEFDCVLKSNTGVISPTIELNLGLTINPSSYNYAYIPDFDRYYWAKEWNFTESTWIASLSVDVLATWRPQIGIFDMYVYRSSAEYDTNIADNRYPTTADITLNNHLLAPMSKKLTDGYYIVSVYGNGNDPNKTVSYVSFDSYNFAKFIDAMYSCVDNNDFWSTLAETVVTGIRNSLFNVSDYLGSCFWSPYDPRNTTERVDTLYIGSYNMDLLAYDQHLHPYGRDIYCYRIKDNANGTVWSNVWNTTIPKHPVSATRGDCYNLAPYSKYKLVFLPFGIFELDTTKLLKYNALQFDMRADGISGEGYLNIYAFNTSDPSNTFLIATKTCNLLVPIPLVYTKLNNFGIMQNMQYEAINQSYASKNATVPLTLLHGISMVSDAIGPEIDVRGGGRGSISELDFPLNGLYATFLGVADEDIASNGRPLCKVRKPQNLGGYIEGESNGFIAPATQTEMEEIKVFLESGFYYE